MLIALNDCFEINYITQKNVTVNELKQDCRSKGYSITKYVEMFVTLFLENSIHDLNKH